MINQRQQFRDDDILFAMQTLPDSLESPETLLLACSRVIQSRDLAADKGRSQLRFSRAMLAGATANARMAVAKRLSQLKFSSLIASRGGRK